MCKGSFETVVKQDRISFEDFPTKKGTGIYNENYKLRYNGGTESFYGSDSPAVLNEGDVYKTTSIKVMNFQTNITLEGIAGEFNSVWFEEV